MSGKKITPERGEPLARRLAEEQQTFARPLRSLLQRPAVTCEGARSVAEAAELMRAQGVGSVVVLDSESRPAGIVTSHDMVRALADAGGAATVAAIMSPDPVSLPAHALAYEAALTMTERRIRHVLVMDEGRLAGVVSERDLFALQRLGLGELTMEMRLAADLGVLGALGAQVRRLAARLVEQGVAPEQLTRFVSALNDRLSQRALEIVRRRHDLERVSWCWLAFGSEGRFEQTLATDQDNGLVFVAHQGAEPAQVRERLLAYAREANAALDACGFPLCKGNVMASNPALCLSLEEWRSKMSGWIEVSAPKALLDAAICFDFRPLFGDASLAAALRTWVSGRVRSHPAFLRHMAQAALQARPALNRLGGFATGDAPNAPGTFNLKLQGARIIIDAARIYALAHGAPQTNTGDRLRAVEAALGRRDVQAAAEAFHEIQRFRLLSQVETDRNQALGPNVIAPERLSAIGQASLKGALHIAKALQSRLALDFQL